MTEKRFTKYLPDSYGYTYITTIIDNEKNKQTGNIDEIVDLLNELDEKYVDEFALRETLQQELQRSEEENEQLKIRNKGKQAFIDKQDKIIRLLYNQCKDFKEILDDSNITYPIDERLNKFFEEGAKL